MGLNTLALGVILLGNPFYAVTDLIAAVIIAAAARRWWDLLRDFKKVSIFSYALMATGAMEIIFSFAFPSEILIDMLTLIRYGLILPLEIYLTSGIADLAIIRENAQTYKMANNLKRPIYVTSILTLCLVALSSVWQWARTLAFVSGISVTVVSVMLTVIIYRLYKDMTNKKDEITDEDTEEKEN